MGILTCNKELSVSRIDCDGTFQVTLALSAAPDIVNSPADIVLALDRSGSMAGSPLANLKSGAKTFIDVIDEATDSARDGYLGYGSRMGIVSFSDTAMENCPLTASVSELKEAVSSLSARGNTNNAAAFEMAAQLFDPHSCNQKVLVLFTDGKSTSGPPAAPLAAALRAEGVVIYCVGLRGSRGLDVAELNEWATDPDASHVFITPDDADLSDLFAGLAGNISKPGATNISIEEEVTSDFQITSILTPTKGVASLTGATTLLWNIEQLGGYGDEGATLEFFVQHVGNGSGTKAVNASVCYQDDQGNQALFPSPTIRVDCDLTVIPDGQPQPVELCMEPCQDTLEFNAGDIQMGGLGRILQLKARLKNVCPGRRVALAAVLSEDGPAGEEKNLGLRVFTIPAHNGPCCRDVLVRCISFVLPEEACGCGPELCGKRSLKVRFFAQYLDVELPCCGPKD